MNKAKLKRQKSNRPTARGRRGTTVLSGFGDLFKNWLRASPWRKLYLFAALFLLVSLGAMYGVSRWHMARHADRPLIIGATFVPDYAVSLGLDPKETMNAIIHDLDIKHLRLVSYWTSGEPQRDRYDFSFLDWQMQKAHEKGVRVSLSIGLRQPRWPECHMPDWAERLPKSDWKPELYNYIAQVVKRYRDHPALESWQLENEFFLKVFGVCPDHSRDRLIRQFNLVKSLDDTRPLIVTRSNNTLGWPIGQPQADMTALTVYKRVWDKNLTRRYFEYPLPPWYYGFLAGMNELWNGTETFVHELQAEAWLPEGYSMPNAPIEELYKSLSPGRLEHRIHYGVDTGIRRIDLWGVEWWYQMKTKRGAPELWQTAQATLAEVRAEK